MFSRFALLRRALLQQVVNVLQDNRSACTNAAVVDSPVVAVCYLRRRVTVQKKNLKVHHFLLNERRHVLGQIHPATNTKSPNEGWLLPL